MSIQRHTPFLALLLALVLPAPSARAAPAVAPSASVAKTDVRDEPDSEQAMAPDSPRAAVNEFRRSIHAGDYAGASRYLDLAQADAGDGPSLARRLGEVLERRLSLDAAKISPDSRGNTADNQAPDREELATIRGASGKPEAVVLVRKSHRPGSHWVFAASTVAQIDGWYEHLESVWLSERLPKPLLQLGPRMLRWWQWVALAPLLAGAWVVSSLLTRSGRLIARRSLSEQYAAAVHQLHGPVTLALMVAFAYATLPWLGLYQPAIEFLHRWCSALLLVALFWALWRGVELSRHSVSSSRWARETLSAHSLLSLGTRLAKFAVAAAAIVIVLSQLGYQATTILTGLGIGGVALALAAQKTVENLFGAFSLAIDQPFREGDTIKVDGIDGVVEAVGLRSTRIRTADRTVISIPNGKLAEMRVETVSRQDRMRFYCVVGLAHSTGDVVERVLSELKALLGAEPLVAKDSLAVRFVALTDSAMNIEVVAMLDTIEGAKFADAKERLLLGIVRIVDASGAELAHPVRSLEIVQRSLPGPASGPDSSSRLSKTG